MPARQKPKTKVLRVREDDVAHLDAVKDQYEIDRPEAFERIMAWWRSLPPAHRDASMGVVPAKPAPTTMHGRTAGEYLQRM